MTNEEQNRAMSELLGLCAFEGTGVRETRDGSTSEFCVKCGRAEGAHEEPDFTEDLNAIHDAEKRLNREQAMDCMDWTSNIVRRTACPGSREEAQWLYHTADAATRCEAILRATGRWRE